MPATVTVVARALPVLAATSTVNVAEPVPDVLETESHAADSTAVHEHPAPVVTVIVRETAPGLSEVVASEVTAYEQSEDWETLRLELPIVTVAERGGDVAFEPIE